MKLVSVKYKKYSFPLNHLIKISNQSITKKDVIIIRAQDEIGNFHFGEVSPLPGFSVENIEECESKLNEFLTENVPIEIDEFKNQLKQFNNYPALLFGFEQLVFSSEIDKSDSSTKEVKSNGLIGIDSEENVVQKMNELSNKGFKTIKLKIGRLNFKDDLAILERLQNEFGSKIRIRLDNNASWNLSDAEQNIKLLSNFNIEYIEQPVNDINDLFILAEKSKISIAADESVLNLDHAVKFIDSGLIKYLVLKPSIRLGVFDTLKTIELASKRDVKIIISSAFESAIGRNTLLYLSSMLKNTTHGLSAEILGAKTIQTNIDYDSFQIRFNNSNLFSFLVSDFR